MDMQSGVFHARDHSISSRRKHVFLASVTLACAVVAVGHLAGDSSGRPTRATELSVDAVVHQFLKEHETYDVSSRFAIPPPYGDQGSVAQAIERARTPPQVRVPPTAKPGSSFIVNVPGHAPERVLVPKDATPGKLLSISIAKSEPQRMAARQRLAEKHASTQALQMQPRSIMQQLQDDPIAADAGVTSFGDAVPPPAGGAPTGVAPAGVVPAQSADAQQAGAAAVASTHEWFKKQETVDQRWVPGDTQALPKLQPLGAGSTGAWTSSPLIYGDQTGIVSGRCKAICPACSAGTKTGFYCDQCRDVCTAMARAEYPAQDGEYAWGAGTPRGVRAPAGWMTTNGNPPPSSY